VEIRSAYVRIILGSLQTVAVAKLLNIFRYRVKIRQVLAVQSIDLYTHDRPHLTENKRN
jgi:hypothetical protein